MYKEIKNIDGILYQVIGNTHYHKGDLYIFEKEITSLPENLTIDGDLTIAII